MAKIAFLLLCHRAPEEVIAQARRLTAAGDCIAIHYDARSPRADYECIREALRDDPDVTFPARRVRCGWGEWSLVEATLLLSEASLSAFPEATHFYMVSGDCMPVKSARYAHALLDATPADYIESHDFFESDWIRTGMKAERLIYRHWFNERRHKRLFYWSWWTQRRLGLSRRPPEDLRIRIGSQWWCLRRATLEAVLGFLRERPDVRRFFRTTWIPDETVIQTLVRHLVPSAEIRNRSLTFLMFSDYGMPVTFYNDHHDLLLGQDALLARKVSPEAAGLRHRLGALYASGRDHFDISGEGRQLFTFLTARGRVGQRFAPRFWEAGGSVGQERELLILVCKKWHVAKRLAGEIRERTGIPALDYVFDEEGAWLPDLGGIERSMAKRARHRRALVRMIADWYGTDRLVLCLDPAGLALIEDFHEDRCETRLLEIDCEIGDDFLAAHARRIGLAGENAGEEALERLLPTLRHEVRYESDALRARAFPSHHRLRERAGTEENAAALAAFLSLGEPAARELAEVPNLFDD